MFPLIPSHSFFGLKFSRRLSIVVGSMAGLLNGTDLCAGVIWYLVGVEREWRDFCSWSSLTTHFLRSALGIDWCLLYAILRLLFLSLLFTQTAESKLMIETPPFQKIYDMNRLPVRARMTYTSRLLIKVTHCLITTRFASLVDPSFTVLPILNLTPMYSEANILLKAWSSHGRRIAWTQMAASTSS